VSAFHRHAVLALTEAALERIPRMSPTLRSLPRTATVIPVTSRCERTLEDDAREEDRAQEEASSRASRAKTRRKEMSPFSHHTPRLSGLSNSCRLGTNDTSVHRTTPPASHCVSRHAARHPDDRAHQRRPRELLDETSTTPMLVPPGARATAAGDPDDESSWIDAESLAGQRIGSTVLVRLLARGGMGAVYEAVQDSPRRPVAVKIVRGGFDSPRLVRRFEYEAEILAHLRHPHIAQVHEVGAHRLPTAERIPYFVMELVPEARALTLYAVDEDLDVRQRLELFRAVCETIHFGHQRGVIHRDIKPGNILVDANGTPKVIDFGIARATDADLAVTTIRTRVGQIVGTLQYMSPEQCAADSAALDLRSDVYSLGVVLYELLCGRLPYSFDTTAVHEAVRVVQDAPPRRPSAVTSAVRGDLETIVLKALEKDPARRYASAAELADDIRRYLDDEPIAARRPTFLHQVRLFARRRRALFVASIAILVSLVAATIVSSVFFLNERAARHRTELLVEEGQSLAVWALEQHDDELRPLAESTPVRRELARRIRAYLEQLSQNASANTALQLDVAAAWRRLGDVLGSPYEANLGQPAAAIGSYEQALEVYARVHDLRGNDRRAAHGTAVCRMRLADVLVSIGKPASVHLDAAEIELRGLLRDAPDDSRAMATLAQALRRLADAAATRGDLDAAKTSHREAIDLARRALDLRPASEGRRFLLAVTHAEFGTFLRDHGEAEAAAEQYRSFRDVVPADLDELPARARLDGRLSLIYQHDGDLRWAEHDIAAALVSYEKASCVDAQRVDADPTNAQARTALATSTERIGYAVAELGRHKEAAAAFRRSIEASEAVLAVNPDDAYRRRALAVTCSLLGRELLQLDSIDDALVQLRRALELDEARLAARPQSARALRDVAADCKAIGDAHRRLAAAGDPASALAHLRTTNEWYVRCLNALRDLEGRGALGPDDVGKPRAMADLVERFGALIEATEKAITDATPPAIY